MAFITLPLGIRVAVEFTIQDAIVVNVYHVTTTDPIVSIKLLDIAQLFVDWWGSDQKTDFSHDIALTSVTALNVSIPNGEKQTVIVSPPEQGIINTPAPPNNVAFVISYATAQTGRSFQGRSYLAGLPEDAITDNDLSIAKVANLVTSSIALTADLIQANAELVVASFQAGGVPRVTGLATPVTVVSMNTRVDTQRRRLPSS